jgi:hypothetical protein
MATPNRKLQRICAGFALLVVAAVSSGCAARAEYVYDDEPVYRRAPVYSAPPAPVVVYHDHDYYRDRPVYVAPAPRARVGVYSAPLVHRPPPAYHRHESHHDHHDHHDHDDRHHR